jgi:uncharacterized protein YndB with AHSA1/START domain
MKTEPLVIERTLNAPVTKVWKALTDLEQLGQWFSKLDDFKPEVGFEFVIPDSYPSTCKVTEAIPDKKLSYMLCFDEYPAITIVTFELFDEGRKTNLRVTHEGLEKIPAVGNPDFERIKFLEGWGGVLAALQLFLENA